MTTVPLIARVAAVLSLAAAAHAGEAATPDHVRIIVEQSYEAREPLETAFEPLADVELPVADVVEDIVFAIGADVAEADDGLTEAAEIAVKVNGRALGRRYLERDNAYLYTGAQLNGEVRLTTADGEVYRRTFAGLTPMPFQLTTVNLGYEQPVNAPFVETLERPGGLANAVAEVMVAAWGVEAILPALLDGDDTARADVANLLGDMGESVAVPALIEALEFDDNGVVRQRAAWSLGRIGDSRAVPSLIEALDDVYGDVRWFAGWSLRNITGEDFDLDHDAWSDWWDKNGGEIEG